MPLQRHRVCAGHRAWRTSPLLSDVRGRGRGPLGPWIGIPAPYLRVVEVFVAFFRATIRGKVPSDVYQFGFILQSDDGVSNLADDVAGAFITAYGTTQRADFPNTVTFDDVYVSEVSQGTGVVVDTAVATIGTAGTAATNCLPPQCAMVISVLPVVGTVRGRFYLPPFNSGILNIQGRMSSTGRDRHGNAWQAFFNALGSMSSPARLGIWRTGSNTFVASKGVSAGDVIDTQRRRRNKAIESRANFLVL